MTTASDAGFICPSCGLEMPSEDWELADWLCPDCGNELPDDVDGAGL